MCGVVYVIHMEKDIKTRQKIKSNKIKIRDKSVKVINITYIHMQRTVPDGPRFRFRFRLYGNIQHTTYNIQPTTPNIKHTLEETPYVT